MMPFLKKNVQKYIPGTWHTRNTISQGCPTGFCFCGFLSGIPIAIICHTFRIKSQYLQLVVSRWIVMQIIKADENFMLEIIMLILSGGWGI